MPEEDPEQMKKIPFGVRAELNTATKEEMKEIAIYGDKGIPLYTPDGSKIFLISIDNSGNIISTEVTE